jgi:hypothetical protein
MSCKYRVTITPQEECHNIRERVQTVVAWAGPVSLSTSYESELTAFRLVFDFIKSTIVSKIDNISECSDRIESFIRVKKSKRDNLRVIVV